MGKIKNSFFSILTRVGYMVFRIDFEGKLQILKQSQYWNHEQRDRWRLNRLNKILEFCWNNVPFYQQFWHDHGLKHKPLHSIKELQKYPIVSKQDLKKAGELIRPKNLAEIRYVKKYTGGSTSEPLHYLLDYNHWALMEAFQFIQWKQLGYIDGAPVGVLAGGSLVPERMTLKDKLRQFVQRRTFLYGVSMTPATAKRYCNIFNRKRIIALYGYPSIIYLFAKALHEQNLEIPTLKFCVTTAEMLTDHYRKQIENILKCEVFNNYGSNDGGIESFECKLHNGLHYNDLQSILETETTDNNTGKLLITNLWNKSTPFIRYENGDLVSLADKLCPCGSAFPLIASVKGRSADILTFESGVSLSGPGLTLIFGRLPIDGWQIAQIGLNEIEVRLLSNSDIDQTIVSSIKRILNYHLKDKIQIEIKRVNKLNYTAGGKLKPILNELNYKYIRQ